MDEEQVRVGFAILTALVIRRRRRRRRGERRVWVCPIFTQRVQQGEYHNLLQEMRLSDPESHFRYLRMSKERFDFLLGKVNFFWIFIYKFSYM